MSNSNEAKARAEANFKRKEGKARESNKAWADYQVQYRGVDEKIARLRALRLAKEAAEADAKGKKEAQGNNKVSPRSRWNRDPRKILSLDFQPHE